MKFIFLIAVFVGTFLTFQSSFASDYNGEVEYLPYPNKGYRGFVDVSFGKKGSDMSMCSYQVSTWHGFQFNPYFHLGMGSIVEIDKFDCNRFSSYCNDAYVCLIDFLAARFEILKSKCSPFIEGRFGPRYQLNVSKGDYSDRDGFWQNMPFLYYSPSIGVRYDNFSFAISYDNNYVTLDMTGYYNNYEVKKNFGGLSFHLGIDFGSRAKR